jgi:hypothetical protein
MTPITTFEETFDWHKFVALTGLQI